MFIKPFRTKSNNQLKGTDRKKLCEELLQSFPKLKEEEVQNLLKKKDVISVMKIFTYNGRMAKLYCAAKIPIFLYFDLPNLKGYVPTIYTLWQHPDLLYSFTTRSMVIPKILNGADLMIPGLVFDGPVTLYSFGKMEKGTLVSVNTDDNKAPFAVGITALSSEDMYMCGGRGKCVEIINVDGDHLSQMMDKPLERPNLGKALDALGNSVDSITDELKRECILDKIANSACECKNNLTHDLESKLLSSFDPAQKDAFYGKNNLIEGDVPLETSSDEIGMEEQPVDPVEEMDKLLDYCFLKACKMAIKKEEIPMLASTFFKKMVLVCPPDKSLDIKKSSYKKLSALLLKMKGKELVDTTIFKGVESLSFIKFDDPRFRNLVIKEVTSVFITESSNAPVITECYKVTANVVPVLSRYGYAKGDTIMRAEIRRHFTDYVKKENLQDGKILTLNPLLAGIFKTKECQETTTMEDGINKFIGKMTQARKVVVGDKSSVFTGKLEPIDISVVSRTNNKKVTLVTNIEMYGLKLEEFSKECQEIGASATVTQIPGKKTPSVLVQGNQVIHVFKLLTNKYQINKNFIKGLENAPKKKK